MIWGVTEHRGGVSGRGEVQRGCRKKNGSYWSAADLPHLRHHTNGISPINSMRHTFSLSVLQTWRLSLHHITCKSDLKPDC